VLETETTSQDVEIPAAQNCRDDDLFSDADLHHSLYKPLCHKCGFEVDIFRAQLKNKSKASPKFICRNCNCITAILSRNIDVASLKLCALPQDAYQQFWRDCAAQREGCDQFRYSKIRAQVIESLTTQQIKVASVKVSEESLPLSVWGARGFDVRLIEAAAQSEDHPILGTCYKVPLRTYTKEEIARSIQEEVLKAERRLKKPKAESSANGDADGELICLDDFESDDESGEPSPKGAKLNNGSKAGKAGKKAPNPEKTAALLAKSEAKKAELLKKKHRAEAEKANQKVFVLATKTMGAVAAVLVELEQARKSKCDRIPGFITEKLDECYDHLQLYKTQSQDRLAKSGKAATKGVELEKLDFTQADVADYVKEANQFLGKFKKMQSII
jgi:hypothetical protein